MREKELERMEGWRETAVGQITICFTLLRPSYRQGSIDICIENIALLCSYVRSDHVRNNVVVIDVHWLRVTSQGPL